MNDRADTLDSFSYNIDATVWPAWNTDGGAARASPSVAKRSIHKLCCDLPPVTSRSL
jgi:hypothetical protein